MISEKVISTDALPQAESVPASHRGFPRFQPLATVAFAANVPLLAWMLILGHVWAAMSIAAGLVVGLAVYGSLYLFVGRGLDFFLAGVRGRAKPATGGATAMFALLLPLKYLLIGGLMFLLIRGGHLSIFWFVVGFLITQVSVSLATVRHLVKQPRF